MKSPTLLQQTRAKTSEIVVRDRLRPVSAAGVAALISSIEETGVMKDAIHLRKKKDGRLYLVAGAHRLAAALELGWDEIEAKIWAEVTDDWALLMEIDDNLAGAEMNALDTAIFLAERKEVYERLHPEAKAGVFKGNRHTGSLAADTMSATSFATATAEKFGLTDRHVRRLIAAGACLGAKQVAQLRTAPKAVTLADLSEIAKIADPEERSAVVSLMSGGFAKSAADARRTMRVKAGVEAPVKDPVEAQFQALAGAWQRASAAVRRRFFHEFSDDIAAMEGGAE